jgi:predicted XRE-type DNA-binding protein
MRGKIELFPRDTLVNMLAAIGLESRKLPRQLATAR